MKAVLNFCLQLLHLVFVCNCPSKNFETIGVCIVEMNCQLFVCLCSKFTAVEITDDLATNATLLYVSVVIVFAHRYVVAQSARVRQMPIVALIAGCFEKMPCQGIPL